MIFQNNQRSYSFHTAQGEDAETSSDPLGDVQNWCTHSMAEWPGRDNTQFLSYGDAHGPQEGAGMGLLVPKKAVFGSLKCCLPWWISHCSSAFPGSTDPAEVGMG